ncbi:hypothetical protein PISMIDRAFT_685481 [Pisolithus microcarpus 441]|uniref:Uncharacterized protein n=1 Tax=Pisolithus microcarpus 441 TaxID=765257 RepID=A0A0C9YT62_9AGAM|nr:hypothetical protein PISMIDRAFT_685481 [Pisolithus microcarpus 441]
MLPSYNRSTVLTHRGCTNVTGQLTQPLTMNHTAPWLTKRSKRLYLQNTFRWVSSDLKPYPDIHVDIG